MQEFINIEKDLKYISLYNKLYFFEYDKKNVYCRKINNYDAIIKLNDKSGVFLIENKKIINLDTHDSFVLLELIVYFLEKNISINDMTFDQKNNFIYLNFPDKKIKIFYKNWDDYDIFLLKKKYNNSYSSRLWSGIVERKYFFSKTLQGYFENYLNNFNYEDKCILVTNGELVKLKKKDAVEIFIPEKVISIKSGVFSNNLFIKKVHLPKSLISLGGDTFYNSENLEYICIPSNVKVIGDNPFAGCNKLKLENKSSYFKYENGILYNENYTEIIYCDINNKKNKLAIPSSVKIINKHSFYKCKNLREIVLPENLIKMSNNPFSGCFNLKVKSNSKYFFIYKKYMIYNFFKDQIISYISNNEINDVRLLKSTKIISRNSFWNCKFIKNMYIDENIEQIGYNPFASCERINFIVNDNNNYYSSENSILYNKDKTKLIAYPKLKAIGHVEVIDSVIELERGAFSNCDEMTSINLKNVSIINNKCFSNCNKLMNIFLSDLLSLIGDGAFSYCSNLKKVSYFKNTKCHEKAFENSDNVNIEIRNIRQNYLFNSDNIFTLKSMLNSYENKVDLILIDPPYNSNIQYIEYNDFFGDSYINFIDDRIKYSKKLLSNNGWLIITIDDNGLDAIMNVCKKYFEIKNILLKKWEKLHPFFDKNRIKRNPNKKDVLYEYIIFVKNSSKSKLNKIFQPYIEKNIVKEKLTIVPNIFSCFGTNSSAKDEIYSDFGDRYHFSTPKPVKLFKELIRATTNDNSIVLDYFAGSGTTGIACIELNNETKSNRNYILINNSENNICKLITNKRLKKHIKFENNDFIFV